MKSTLTFFLLSVAAYGQANRITNGSFETADTANPNLAAGWGAYGAPYTRSAFASAWESSYVAYTTYGQGAVQRVVLNQQASTPVRITVRVKGDAIADDPADKVGASLGCKVTYRDGTAAWCPETLKTKNTGTFDWKWVGYNTANLPGGSQMIDTIEVRLHMGNVAGNAWFDAVRVEEWIPGSGMVTFRFDDSFLSTYLTAYPMLKAKGFVGTEAAVTSYLGNANFMSLAQLKDLYTNGWSVISHTVTHRDLTSLPLVALNDELYWSHKYLVDAGMVVRHLALPFGAYNGLVLSRAQMERYAGLPYLSVTSSDSDRNPRGVFPYVTYVHPVTSNTTMAQVNSWIATAQSEKAWLVFLIHEIDNPNGIYTVTSSMFQSIINAVAASGLPVVTYDQGFQMTAQ